jgi:hypothetical protein
MKNILEEILRFKKNAGLLLEEDGCTGDCKNGKGVLTKENDFTYDGEFKNQKFNGKGSYTKYEDGKLKFTFNGEFKDNQFLKGLLDHKKSNYIFDGEFKDSKPSKGKMTINGVAYIGTFAPNGKTDYIFKSDDGKINTDNLFEYVKNIQEKEKYKSFCIEGDCENGKGIYLGPLGRYNGKFKDGKFNGYGRLNTNISESDQVVENIDLTKNFHNHKFTYAGNFMEGSMFGQGSIMFYDKISYEGDFKENKINGKGVFLFPDGSEYQGIFRTIPKDDNYYSTYSFETSDGLITDDLIKYNKENPVQNISFEKNEPTSFKTIFDLKVSIASGKRNKIITGFTENTIEGKEINLILKNTLETKYKFDKVTRFGRFTLGDFKLGNYDYVIIVKEKGKLLPTKYKGNINIGKQYMDGITFVIEDINLQENFLMEDDKIKFLKAEDRKQKQTCEVKIEEFYKIYSDFYSNKVTLNEFPEQELLDKKNIVEGCIKKYYDFLKGDIKKYSNYLTNVPPKPVSNTDKTLQYYFDINFNINENKDIYNKTNTMSVTNSLRKVLKEFQYNKESLITEKKIIRNRFNYIFESNFKNKFLCMKNLNKEKNELIKKGYNQKLVRESFIDIASTLYGGEESNVNILNDLKTKLGQKIADQVKNKQTEHEMILNAFNQIPDDVIKMAIDKSDVNTLTNEIANRALENYKNQFGEGGIGGAFISSVDNEKFKIEVNKILKPAIEGLTNSISDKVKKIRDIMAGNGQSDITMSET